MSSPFSFKPYPANRIKAKKNRKKRKKRKKKKKKEEKIIDQSKTIKKKIDNTIRGQNVELGNRKGDTKRRYFLEKKC